MLPKHEETIFVVESLIAEALNSSKETPCGARHHETDSRTTNLKPVLTSDPKSRKPKPSTARRGTSTATETLSQQKLESPRPEPPEVLSQRRLGPCQGLEVQQS